MERLRLSSLFWLFTSLLSVITSDGLDGQAAGGWPLPIHLLRPRLGSERGHHAHGFSCDSWRLAIETNNIRDWKTVPAKCGSYVGHYMLGGHYRDDSRVVADSALAYAKTLNLSKGGKDAWVFDIDETTLSNLPYYAKHGFGIEPYKPKAFNAWVDTGKAPALPESLRLYKNLLSLGFKIVFLTGRNEPSRTITEANLKNAGYHTWEKLILRGAGESGTTAMAYKSAKRKALEEEGYRILGNIGDQWSDILGSNVGQRTFKLPDPIYYIA